MANRKSKAIGHVNLVDRIVDAVRDSILSGELEPGSRIGISRLAEQYEVSIIPVREALSRLLLTRLVTSEANRGYFVAEIPTADAFQEFVDARVFFEISAVRIGVENAGDADIAKLSRLNEKMRKLAKSRKQNAYVEWNRLNVEFHRTLVGLTRNTFISNIYDDLSFGYLQFQLIRSSSEEVPGLEKLVDEHQEMIEALAKRDCDRLTAVLTAHIRDVSIKPE